MSQNVTAANPAAMERVKFKKQSQAKEIWRRFRKNRGSMVGLIMLTIIVLALVFANLITSYDAATAYVRLVRSQILSLSDLEYVEAARAGGAGSARIIMSHIFPNAMGVIIVNTTLNVAKIILYESTLSFLGLGMPPPQPEWGLILSEAREYMRSAPHMLLFPALAIVLTACSVNLIGDGLRDAMDPHLKS